MGLEPVTDGAPSLTSSAGVLAEFAIKMSIKTTSRTDISVVNEKKIIYQNRNKKACIFVKFYFSGKSCVD
jgi:hypothetical protein